MADLKLVLDIVGKDSASASLGAIHKSVSGLSSTIGGLAGAPAQALGGLVNGLGAIGLAATGLGAVTSGIASVATGMVAGNAQMETYTTQFATLLGSTDAAKDRLKELADFGAKTPFELPEVARAEKVLLGFGLTGQKAVELTGKSGTELRTVIGDIAAGTGASFEEIALNFGKFSAGATGESISRLQELGVVTREQMAAMGVEFSKSGELISPLPKAMQAAVQIANEKFGGGMDKLSMTFEGQMSTLSDNFNQAKIAIMQPIFDVLSKSVAGLNDVLGSSGFQDTLKSITEMLAGAVSEAVKYATGLFEIASNVVLAFTDDAGAMGLVYDIIRKVFGDGVADFLQPFLQWFMEAIPSIKSFIDLFVTRLQIMGQIVTKVFSGDIAGAFDLFQGDLKDNTGQIFASLKDWAGAFLGWIGPMIPPLLQQLQALGKQLETWLLGTALPALVSMLGEWAGAFIDWVVPLIPPLLMELGRMMTDMIGWMVDVALPLLLDDLAKWGTAFVEWVAPRIPPLLLELGNLLLQLGTWLLTTALPAITERLVKWGGAFIDWVKAEVLPKIGPTLGYIIFGGEGWVGILPWVAAQALEIGKKLVSEWVPAFLNWVASDLVPKIPPTFQALLKAIGDWITDTAVPWAGENLPKLGSAMVDAIGTAFNGIGAALQAVFQQIKVDVGPFHLSGSGFSIDAPTFPKIELPSLDFGGQRGPTPGSGGFLTIPQFGSMIRALGFNEETIKAICGPIAATGIANGLGKGVSLIDVESISQKIGAYARGAGTFGAPAFQRILSAIGIDSHSAGFQEAANAAMAGIPVAISTPLHYFLAQGFDQATQKFIVGNSGTALRAGAEAMTRQAIEAIAGPIDSFVIPTLQRGGQAAVSAFVDPLSGLSTGFQSAMALVGDVSLDPLQAVTGSVDTLMKGAGAGFAAVGTGASLLGQAVRDALRNDAIPAIADTNTSLVDLSGQDALWQTIRDNAGATGRDLTTFLKDTGAVAIDLTTASLSELQARSGLSTIQVQKNAADAGQDIRHWLLETGVPAADALRDSLKVAADKTDGVSQSATNLKDPVNTAKEKFGEFGTKLGDVATNQATQIAAVLLLLRQGLFGLGPFEGKGLIKGFEDLKEAIENLHDKSITVTTHYVSVGSPGGGNSTPSAPPGSVGGNPPPGSGGNNEPPSSSPSPQPGPEPGPEPPNSDPDGPSNSDPGSDSGYANGGVLMEPVRGRGLVSGRSYSFAETGPEEWGGVGNVGKGIDYKQMAAAIVAAFNSQTTVVQMNGQVVGRLVRDEIYKLGQRNGTTGL